MMDSYEEDEAKAALERELQLDEHQRREDLRALMALPAGRRMFWRLIHIDGRLSESSFSAEGTHTTAYFEGRRAGGLRLNNELILAAPEGYVLMMQEGVADLVETARRVRREK